MKNDNDKAQAIFVGALLLVMTALWIGAAILAPAAIIKLCWLYLMG